MGRLNAIFAVTALGLLAVTGIIVGYDYVRGWKWFQWEFLRIQQDQLESQLRSVEASSNFFLLNAPMLDFIAPTFKVDQVVIPDMFVNVNYMDVPRVDRCMTCHRAIDRAGFESKKEAARLEKDLQTKLDSGQIPPEKRPDTEQRIADL